MPIEVRELVIRAIAEGAAAERDEEQAPVFDADARALLVRDCVAEVMRQLRRAQEP
ncbi:DUF5908 family protein [Sphingomonas sp. HF-S4]|uniref:DUF5908 family protein n=1 Tax=Sphingomonas agrestis TaxID=3080540 RepID=A0ABU3Y1X8_9SPHN|nr:DUF5908 family protein [Sphingomonas sp. HF-S4]MDV3455389.1 DUF5908 family protein [Sphingomonas sp. HF-S4]